MNSTPDPPPIGPPTRTSSAQRRRRRPGVSGRAADLAIAHEAALSSLGLVSAPSVFGLAGKRSTLLQTAPS
eukprot:15464097-Alexandrium_andersonii.AAC.1